MVQVLCGLGLVDVGPLGGELDVLIAGLVKQISPGLLNVYGVGVDVAAAILVAVGDNPERIPTEAAFAKLCGVAPLPANSGNAPTGTS